jgi:hypothetical protein
MGMKAQTLYDAREKFEFCSGTDLHEFFEGEIGDPSPSGYRDISLKHAGEFVQAHIRTMRHNSYPTFLEVAKEMRAAAMSEDTAVGIISLIGELNLSPVRL